MDPGEIIAALPCVPHPVGPAPAPEGAIRWMLFILAHFVNSHFEAAVASLASPGASAAEKVDDVDGDNPSPRHGLVQYRAANPAPYVNSGVYWVAHPGCQCRRQAPLG